LLLLHKLGPLAVRAMRVATAPPHINKSGSSRSRRKDSSSSTQRRRAGRRGEEWSARACATMAGLLCTLSMLGVSLELQVAVHALSTTGTASDWRGLTRALQRRVAQCVERESTTTTTTTATTATTSATTVHNAAAPIAVDPAATLGNLAALAVIPLLPLTRTLLAEAWSVDVLSELTTAGRVSCWRASDQAQVRTFAVSWLCCRHVVYSPAFSTTLAFLWSV
jgi:hypothetical protein